MIETTNERCLPCIEIGGFCAESGPAIECILVVPIDKLPVPSSPLVIAGASAAATILIIGILFFLISHFGLAPAIGRLSRRLFDFSMEISRRTVACFRPSGAPADAPEAPEEEAPEVAPDAPEEIPEGQKLLILC